MAASSVSRIDPVLDSSLGMVVSLAYGDALGAPYEFYGSPRGGVNPATCNGELHLPVRVKGRSSEKRTVVGQVTDDTEMSSALVSALLDGKGKYDQKRAVKKYVQWANSKPFGMGRNTRDLFLKVKRVSEYRKRLEEKMAEPEYRWTQSNGCLMRAAPLALAANPLEAARLDCEATNPHPICVNACVVYVGVLRTILASPRRDPKFHLHLKRVAFHLAEKDEVRQTLESALNHGTLRDVGTQKGWVLHGLWCAFRALILVNMPGYALRNIVTWVVMQGGDTDTNAAIAGAMAGAWFGLEQIKAENAGAMRENLRTLIGANPAKGDYPRPYEYSVPLMVERVKALTQFEGVSAPLTLKGGPTLGAEESPEEHFLQLLE